MSRSSSESYSDYDSDEEVTVEYIPYSSRDEWSDVKPEPQDDIDHPVAAIKYSERFRDTFDYFRAILRLNEKSERAFKLTTACIALNASNYTVWYYRRVLIKELNKSLQDELSFLTKIIEKNQKNYQVWHHRQWLIENINEICDEKSFTAKILELDSKNYHCWQHRQWFVPHFNAWDGEVEFTQKLIEQDIRNNSAWNHRFFVISKSEGLTDAVIEREVAFTLEKIDIAPNNESSWSYLRGILDKKGLSSSPRVLTFVRNILGENLNSKTTPHALAFQVDVLTEQIEKDARSPNKDKLVEEAVTLCEQLAIVYDPIRVNYWTYVKDSLRHK